MQGSELCTVRAGWVRRQALGTEGTLAFQNRSDWMSARSGFIKKNVGPGKTGGRRGEEGLREEAELLDLVALLKATTQKPTKEKPPWPEPCFLATQWPRRFVLVSIQSGL